MRVYIYLKNVEEHCLTVDVDSVGYGEPYLTSILASQSPSWVAGARWQSRVPCGVGHPIARGMIYTATRIVKQTNKTVQCHLESASHFAISFSRSKFGSSGFVTTNRVKMSAGYFYNIVMLTCDTLTGLLLLPPDFSGLLDQVFPMMFCCFDLVLVVVVLECPSMANSVQYSAY